MSYLPRALRLALLSLVVVAFGCAEERAPINRVQPNALAKSFFVGDLADPGDDPEFYMRTTVVDAAASDILRESLRSQRSGQEPFFDRGPGYAHLSGGAASAEVDWL